VEGQGEEGKEGGRGRGEEEEEEEEGGEEEGGVYVGVVQGGGGASFGQDTHSHSQPGAAESDPGLLRGARVALSHGARGVQHGLEGGAEGRRRRGN